MTAEKEPDNNSSHLTKKSLRMALDSKNFELILKTVKLVNPMDDESIGYILTSKLNSIEAIKISEAIKERGDVQFTKEHFFMAVDHGNIATMFCTLMSGFKFDDDCIKAVLVNHLAFNEGVMIIRTMLENRSFCFTKEHFLIALKHGNVGMARGLVQYDLGIIIGAEEIIDDECIKAAIQQGGYTGYQAIFAMQHRSFLTKEHFFMALNLGRASIVCCIIDSDLEIDDECINAVFASDINIDDRMKIILRLGKKKNVRFTKEHFFIALNSGKQLMAFHLINSGIEIDDECIKAVIEVGGFAGSNIISTIELRGDVRFTKEQYHMALDKKQYLIAKVINDAEVKSRNPISKVNLLQKLNSIESLALFSGTLFGVNEAQNNRADTIASSSSSSSVRDVESSRRF